MSENNNHPATAGDFKTHLIALHEDAVLWKAKELYKQDAPPHQQQQAVDAIVLMLCAIQKEVTRSGYIDLIYKELKIKRGILSNAVSNKLSETADKNLSATMLDDEGKFKKLPEWVDVQKVYNLQLDWQMNQGHNTGYYFVKKGNEMEHLTNFVLTPLFHIYDRTGGNRRLARLHNAINADKLIELPSKAWISLDRFEELLADEGYYQTLEGFTKPHLKRLFRAIGNDFPKTYELKTLGWQPEGFFAYSNAMFCPQLTTQDSKLLTFNDIGVAQYKNINYYSPAASSIYMTERKDDEGREVMDDDPYENDKYLRLQQSPVSFQQYAQHMMLMHGDAGMPLICYAFVSIFKDIITAYEKCPILYGYGIVQSGKSTWAEGLYYLFYDKFSKPFNLNQGTVYAFFNRMERFRNCPQLFNEFDEDSIDEDFFRAFKSFYDGEGRDRGKGIKGKTETQKINCSVILVGQTLTTKDGASVLSRTIAVNFKDPGERTDAEKRNYDTWNAWTNTGVNSCLQNIIEHRKYFKENFFRTFNEEHLKLKEALRSAAEPLKERIVKNYCILLASGKVMIDAFGSTYHLNLQLQLGFTYDQLFTYCRTNIISLSRMISEVDNLATFWKTVEFLYERGDITDGIDFKLEEKLQVKKKVKDDVLDIPFDKPTKVLYVRLTKTYQLYAQNFRQTTGSKPINQQTLITYFESSKSYLGNDPSSRFKSNFGGSTVTSSYMFVYSKLGINLEREDVVADTRKPEEFEAKVRYMPQLINAGPTPQLMFTVVHHDSTPHEGMAQTIEIQTKCFSKNTELQSRLYPDTKVSLLGLVSHKPGKGGAIYRTMDVERITILSGAITSDAPTEIKFDANDEPGF
jgi:hypothetical protein